MRPPFELMRSVLLAAIYGCLSDHGITYRGWSFWAIAACVAGLELLSYIEHVKVQTWD